MSTEHRESFERKMLEDGLFSEEIEAVEFDLREEYADGALQGPEREHLKTWIDSSSERKAQILVTQGLRRSALKHGRIRVIQKLAWASAIAACLILTISWPLLRARRSALPTKSIVPNATSTPPSVAAKEDVILLMAERLRGSKNNNQVTTYTIHSDARTRLQVILPSGHSDPAYSIRIRPSGGRSNPEFYFDNLLMQGGTAMAYLDVTLAPESLKSGMYVAEIRSRNGVYSQLFRVELVQDSR
jgi:hypothetical protein